MKQTLEKENPRKMEAVQPAETISPDVNIYETNDGYLLEAEMPGVSKDGLEITLDGNELTITGRRNSEVTAGEPLFCERSSVNYQRTFELDPAIDTARINAKMNQGLLTLTLPKSEKVQPRKITVSE